MCISLPVHYKVYVSVSVCMCPCVGALCVCSCECVHVWVHVCGCMCVGACVCIRVCMGACVVCVPVRVCACMCMCVRLCVHVCVCLCVHVCAQVSLGCWECGDAVNCHPDSLFCGALVSTGLRVFHYIYLTSLCPARDSEVEGLGREVRNWPHHPGF